MRKIIASEFITLDGVIQAPGGPEEDEESKFTEGGWSFGYWDDVIGEAMAKETSSPFETLLGRKTYEIFAAHWPNVDPEEDPGADIYNKAKKYVISQTLKEVTWQNSELISGDIEKRLIDLKEQDGPDLVVTGSSKLIQTLLKLDLIDEFKLKIYPVVVGHGKRLFGDGTIPVGLKLVKSAISDSGVIIATYDRAGEIKKGSFA